MQVLISLLLLRESTGQFLIKQRVVPSFAFSLPLSKVANAAVHTFTETSTLNCSNPATLDRLPKVEPIVMFYCFLGFIMIYPGMYFVVLFLTPQYLLQEILICTAYTRFDEFFYLYTVYYQSAARHLCKTFDQQWSLCARLQWRARLCTSAFIVYMHSVFPLTCILYVLRLHIWVSPVPLCRILVPEYCLTYWICLFFMLIWSSENIINKRRNIFNVFTFLHISFLRQ